MGGRTFHSDGIVVGKIPAVACAWRGNDTSTAGCAAPEGRFGTPGQPIEGNASAGERGQPGSFPSVEQYTVYYTRFRPKQKSLPAFVHSQTKFKRIS